MMDAFVNGHRNSKVGIPRADVHTLTVSYVIRILRDCAPDDSVIYFVDSIVSKDVTSDLIIGLPSIKYIHGSDHIVTQ